MHIINKIRGYLYRNGDAGIKALAKELNLDVADVSGYMQGDIRAGRIITDKSYHPYRYYLAPEVREDLLVLDAIDLLEALGYTVTHEGDHDAKYDGPRKSL